jgi:hypothetical protein
MSDFIPPTVEAVIHKDARRRSERVLLVVPLEATWTTNTGAHVVERVQTEVVNAHGALLRLKSAIPTETNLQLTRILPEPEVTFDLKPALTSSRADGAQPQEPPTASARVVWACGPEPPDGLARVGVELYVPSQKFWGISFPVTANTRNQLTS